MILLDPDLDPDTARLAILAKRSKTALPPATFRSQRIPHARTLARFLNEAQAAVKLGGEVTVLLTTDAAIRRLNRQISGKEQGDGCAFVSYRGANCSGDGWRSGDQHADGAATGCGAGHSLATEIQGADRCMDCCILRATITKPTRVRWRGASRLLRGRLRLPQGLIERVAESGAGATDGEGHATRRSQASAWR